VEFRGVVVVDADEGFAVLKVAMGIEIAVVLAV